MHKSFAAGRLLLQAKNGLVQRLAILVDKLLSNSAVSWRSLLHVAKSASALQIGSYAVFWTKSEGGKWIKASQGKLPDKLCQGDKALADCLAGCGFALVDAPPHIVAAAEQRVNHAASITPGHIRTAVRKSKAFQQALKTGALQERLKVIQLPEDASFTRLTCILLEVICFSC